MLAMAATGCRRSFPPYSAGQGPFGAGNKIKGRERHIVTGTPGNLAGAGVHEADVQDRSGAPRVFASIRSLYPWLCHVSAASGYAGDRLRDALKGRLADVGDHQAFGQNRRLRGSAARLDRRATWLGRCRRLKDFEAATASAVAWVLAAPIRTLPRRIARP